MGRSAASEPPSLHFPERVLCIDYIVLMPDYSPFPKKHSPGQNSKVGGPSLIPPPFLFITPPKAWRPTASSVPLQGVHAAFQTSS